MACRSYGAIDGGAFQYSIALEPRGGEPVTYPAVIPPREIGRGVEVAIVGLSLRFPGASDPETFWRNLCGGVESLAFFTERELLADGCAPAQVSDPRWVGASVRSPTPTASMPTSSGSPPAKPS